MGGAETRNYRTGGLSMAPAILPGARIEVRARNVDRPRRGDVLCFLDEGAEPVAHRVIRVERKAEMLRFVARGDLYGRETVIAPNEVTGVVERVAMGPFSYRTGGSVGRLFARLALSRRPTARALRFVVRRIISATEIVGGALQPPS